MNPKPLILVYVILLFGCASIQPLDGGDKDTEAPVILSNQPDSASILVTDNSFSFQFNEYVKLNNPNNLFIISPAQTLNPEFKLRGKELTVKLNDTLLPNTTYSFQFNGGVVDLNEGNPLEEYTYVFSTGSFLDSLQLAFKIINYQTKKACSECKIQLYYSSKDSVILNKKPAYVGFADDNGTVRIKNLADTLFYAYAILDDNKNFKLEDQELISLRKYLYSNTLDTIYSIPIFPYQSSLNKPKRIKTTHTISTFVFDNPVYKSLKATLNDSSVYTFFSGLDTLEVYHGKLLDTSILHFISAKDTFTYTLFPQDYKQPRIKTIERNKDGFNLYYDNIVDSFNHPTITFSIDSLKYSTDSLNIIKNKIVLFTPKIGDSYTFYLPKSYLSKSDSTLNYDTFSYSSINKVSLALTLDGFDDTVQKIIYLKKSKNVLRTVKTRANEIPFYDLQPGSYTISIAEDLNNNNVWDTGNPFLSLEPEPYQVSTEFELRLNWDNQFTIKKL